MFNVSVIGVVTFLALGLALAGDSQAQALTIEQVLDKWAEASGGRDKLAAVTTSHTISTVKTSGLSGTIHEYWSLDGRSAYYLELANGAIKMSGGWSGDSYWQKDMNGQTHQLAGADLQGAVTGRYFSENAQFFTDRSKGTVTLGKSDNPKEIAVVIVPEGGKAVTYFLDAASFLPVRTETQANDRKEFTWYRNRREINGFNVASETQQGTGDTLHDMFISVNTIEVNVPIPDSVFVLPSDRAKDYAFAAGNQARDIPFELVNNHIYVPVKVNGSRTLWFIFDTGAEASCVSKRIAQELGLSTSGNLEGRGGGEKSVSVSLAQGLTYDLPGVKVTDQIAAVISFDQIELVTGKPLDGVLGYDLLSRFVVEIDYARKLITLTEPSDFVYTGSARPMTFELDGKMPIVPVEVKIAGCEPVKGRFLMDTGMRGAMTIASPTVRARNLIACAPATIAAPLDMGVGGLSRIRLTRAASVTIGDYSIADLIIGLSMDTLGAGATTDQVGQFGGEILRRFTVTFDYSRSLLYLAPNDALTEPHTYDMSGLLLSLGENMKDEIRVMSVVPESPADKAGLKIGDLLLVVGDRPTAGMKLWDVRELLKGVPGTPVGVTYRRDGVEGKTTVTLQRQI